MRLQTEGITDIYRFENTIAKNQFCEGWQVTNLRTGRKRFLKVFKSEAASGGLQSFFARSVELQRHIRSRRVITATAEHFDGSALYVEYPYLDQTHWQPLNEKIFWDYFPDCLTQMCLLVDYLHLLKLVHCDLKLANFQVRIQADRVHLVLTDLDFLVLSGTQPEAKIIGSPEHIAPEILDNDAISLLSDNYSLGVAVRKCLEFLKSTGHDDRSDCNQQIIRLQDLVDTLTVRNPLNRPINLIDLLSQRGLIEPHRYAESFKVLLAMQLITEFSCHKPDSGETVSGVAGFLTEQNRVLGLPDEILRDISRAYAHSHWQGYQIFKSLVLEAEIDRFADYWHLSCGDDSLEKAFASANGEESDTVYPSPTGNETSSDGSNLIKCAKAFKQSESFLKAFFCYKRGLENLKPSAKRSTVKEALYEASILAGGLNRMDEALHYYLQVLELCESGSEEYFDVLRRIIGIHLRLGNLDIADEFTEKGLKISVAYGAGAQNCELLIFRAWTCAARGKYDEAKNLYESLATSPDANNPVFLHKLYGCMGILSQKRGDRTGAEQLFKRSMNMVSSDEQLTDSNSILANYAMLSFQLAKYQTAIRVGKQAVKHAQAPDDTPNLPMLYLTISNSLTRLGQSKKAIYWLQKYLERISSCPDRYFLALYFCHLGWIEMNSGRLQEAGESLRKSIDILSSDQYPQIKCKVYQTLAKNALYLGNRKALRGYVADAGAICGKIGDPATQAEVTLIGLLDSFLYDNQPGYEQLATHLDVLLKLDCHYYAALGLFHLILRGSGPEPNPLLTKSSELLATARKSEVPLFKALASLVSPSLEIVSGDDRIVALKDVYRSFEDAGQLFLATVVCDEIGNLYFEAGKRRLAIKFWNQSLKLAENMGNQLLSSSLHEKLDKDGRDVTYLETKLEALGKISEILKDIDRYDTTLERIVQFAVEETGAERGALLLRSKENGELQTKAFVNCDSASLKDIWNLSRSIPSLVAQTATPLMIDNAMYDDRTKNLKSIILHNIHSVACIPIRYNNETVGALYLDHHSIPTLFDDSDLAFVKMLANLVAVVLLQADHIRTEKATAHRLTNELVGSGRGHRFLTVNQSLNAMLEKLPEIAHTNASVLLMGESGTGKEIICEMIHQLSLRAGKPLVKLNCAAIAGTLIESELFGIAKGVATGVENREGKFSAADGGTLFLDEIADMPPDVQAKVLRVIESQEFEKVGSNRTVFVDVRFISATNRHLKELINGGKFRADLLYRINTVVIEIPPLRERAEDIPLLLDHYLETFSHGERRTKLADDAIQVLTAYTWPGNVRELRNFVERMCILAPRGIIGSADLPDEMLRLDQQSREEIIVDLADKSRLLELLTLHSWNQSKVARIMNLPLTTLRRKLKKYKLAKPL